MDHRPEPPKWLPVAATPAPPPAEPDRDQAPAPLSSSPPPDSPPPPRRSSSWRRLTRSRRGAAGLAIAVAALLLWPFSGWSALPWLIGLGVLVVLRLLRLDGLLRGWAWPVGGLVVVAGLMYSTTPWAWALAAGIGVLLAGLAQLPWWRLAAVGAVICVVAGVGFGISTHQTQQERRAQEQVENEQSYGLEGERTPERVLGALLEDIAQNDVPAFCGLLDEQARVDVLRIAAAVDCSGALATLRARAPAPTYKKLDATTTQSGTTWLTDACRTAWAAPSLGGPTVGRIEIRKSPPPGGTYFISRFLPC